MYNLRGGRRGSPHIQVRHGKLKPHANTLWSQEFGFIYHAQYEAYDVLQVFLMFKRVNISNPSLKSLEEILTFPITMKTCNISSTKWRLGVRFGTPHGVRENPMFLFTLIILPVVDLTKMIPNSQ